MRPLLIIILFFLSQTSLHFASTKSAVIQADPIQVSVTCNGTNADCMRFLRTLAAAYGFQTGVDGPDTNAARKSFIERKVVDQLVTIGAGVESDDDAKSARELKRQEFEGKFKRNNP